MSTLALIALFSGALTVDVQIAPDQPIPHVYADEPLVIELGSHQDIDAGITVEITGPDGVPVQAFDKAMSLHAKGTRWIVVGKAPPAKGNYSARIVITGNGESQESTHRFCRVDRPMGAGDLPVCAAVTGTDPGTLLALQGLPLSRVRLPMTDKETAAAVQRLAKQDFRVSVGIADASPEAVASLAQHTGEAVALWEMAPTEDGGKLAEACRSGGSPAPIALVTADPSTLAGSLASCGGCASIFALQNDAPRRSGILALRRAAERLGHENASIHVVGRGLAEGEADTGERLARQLLLNLAVNVEQTTIDAGLLYGKDGFGAAYAYVSALAHRFARAEYVGELEMAPPVYALTFRSGTDWLIALWTTGDPQEVTLPAEGATNLSVTDGRNNILPVPEVREGALPITIDGEPRYVSGQGGDILHLASRHAARLEAEFFLANGFGDLLPPGVLSILQSIAGREAAKPDHKQLLALFRMVNEIEKRWHGGEIAQEKAVPALASLVRLMRRLAVLEQEIGEPFLEPLQKTLADCGEFQSHYLTSSGGLTGDHRRGDWLLTEVTRLVEEATALAEEGRRAEADVLGNLAEWRARALESTIEAARSSETKPEASSAEKKAGAAKEGDTS